MPSKKGYLIPEVIDPTTRRCVTIWVPDDQLWWAAFWGQMTSLIYPYLWEGTPTQQAEVTAVWNGVLETARQYWLSGECTLPIEFRNNGGNIEWRPDPSAAWIDLGVACPCPPVVASPQYNPNAPTFADRACGIATGLVDWIMEKYNDTIDQIEAAADTVAAFDAIIIIFTVPYVIVDQVLDAINEVFEAGTSVARAEDTVDLRDAMTEWLYCAMLDTGEMTADIWSDFKLAQQNDFPTVSPAGKEALEQYLAMFEVEAMLDRARIESYGEGNCVTFSCNYDWEHITTFDDATFKDWNVFGGRAMTATNTGIQAGILTSGVVTRRQVTIYNNMPYKDGTTQLMEMRTYYAQSAIGNSNSAGDPNFGNMRVFSAAAGTGSIILDSGTKNINAGDGEMDAGDLSYNVPANASLLFYAQFAQRDSAPNVTGEGFVTEIRIRGNGKNPFVP